MLPVPVVVNPLSPGRLGMVHYLGGVGDIWHERLLLTQVSGTSWAICTPDDDVYVEEVGQLDFTPSTSGRTPPGLAGAMLYRFSENLDTAHDAESWADLFVEGIAAAQIERANAGLAAPDGADNAALQFVTEVRRVGLMAARSQAGGAPAAAAGVARPVGPAGPAAVAGVAAVPGAGALAPAPGIGVGVVGPGGGAMVAAVPPGLPGGLAAAGVGAAAAAAAAAAPAAAFPGSKWRVQAASPTGPKFWDEHTLTPRAQVMGDIGLDFDANGLPLIIREVKPVDEKAVLEALSDGAQKALQALSGLQGYVAGGSPTLPATSGSSSTITRSVDARVAAVRYDERGERFRLYTEAIHTLEEPAWKDWPLQGPRTVRWLCNFIRDNGGTPRQRTQKFMTDAKVPEADRVKYEHTVLMEILEWSLVYDQLDVSALAGFEILARRVALLEEAYTANPKNPRFDGSEHFTGFGRRGAAIAPQLTQHVAQALQSDAMIQKERRKAREEAALQKK